MNRKGFVLVETIITSVFVLGFLVFIVSNVLPVIGEYKKTNEYDTIDAVYDAHLIRKMLLGNSDPELTSSLLCSTGYSSCLQANCRDYYMFDKDTICSYVEDEHYCKILLSRNYLDVKEIVVTSYEIKDQFVKASKKFDRGMREYIAQMQKYTLANPNQYSEFFTNRLIVYFNDGRIANIELIVESGGDRC